MTWAAWADALDRRSATTEEFFSVRLGNLWNRLAELAAEDFAKQGEHRGVQRAVVGQQSLRRGNPVRAAMHFADRAARLGDQQRARRHIPGLESELPERVETTAGDIGQIDGGRSGAPDSVRCHGHLVVEVDVDVLVPLAAGKSGGSQAILQP